MARLDQLNQAKDVAQLGAILGREFGYEMLQVISPRDDETLQVNLAQLFRKRAHVITTTLRSRSLAYKIQLTQDFVAACWPLVRSARSAAPPPPCPRISAACSAASRLLRAS